MAFQDHFSSRAPLYARARPTYPPALFSDLAASAPGRRLAWDCGTGNGQAAVLLAAEFEAVTATDPSEAQLHEAQPHPRVSYRQGAEDASGLAAGGVDLVTAAQAAHWFDMRRFGAEATRVLRPRGICAIWCYGLCSIAPEIDRLLEGFYRETIGRYWPPDRVHVDQGYRDLLFPFSEFVFPACAMRQQWTAEEFGAYLRTWSAVVRYQKEHNSDPVTPFMVGIFGEWGSGSRTVTFPLSGRIGRVG